MGQNLFGLLFIVGSAILLIAVDHYYGLENFKSFFLMPILAAYFIGRYSTTLPKEEN
jgi:hypothetical protein